MPSSVKEGGLTGLRSLIVNVVLCDGGLSNRLNALIGGLILKQRFGHAWKISWPVNNWCGAPFEVLFDSDLETTQDPITYFKAHEDEYKLVMHENQCQFRPEHVTLQSQLSSFEDYRTVLDSDRPVLYYHNLLPGFVEIADICEGLSALKVNSVLRELADSFCQRYSIDSSVLGMHIRKTDFGDTVDDAGLFRLASTTAHRYFVCSDDPEVNRRFAALTNCVVFEKSSFPEKFVMDQGWNPNIEDSDGRTFPFNIVRSEASIIEALIDLLILSRTTHINTSHSTFLRMAMIFKACKFF